MTMEHIGGYTPEGEAAARAGMAAAERATSETMKREVRRAIQWLAEHRPTFTSDDVWACLEGEVPGFEAPAEPPVLKKQALGSMMRAASLSGVIEHTGQVQASRRQVRHSGTVAIWRSCLYSPVAQVTVNP